MCISHWPETEKKEVVEDVASWQGMWQGTTVAVTVAGSCGWMRMDHKIKHNASKINRNGLPS